MLADPLGDPFAAEVIAVPTRGIERWLAQTLVGAPRGVCANVAFPFPHALVGGAVAVATGIDPDVDPWRPERAVWPLLEVVGECLRGAVAAQPCGASRRRGRRAAARAAVRDHPARRRAVRPLRAAPAGDGPRMGARRGRRRPRAGGVAGGAVAAAARPAGRAEPGRATRGGVRAAARDAVAARPARARLALRPDAAAEGPPRRAQRAGRRARGAPLPPAPLARALGQDRAPAAGRPPCRGRAIRAARGTGCSPRGARTRARCSSCSARTSASSITTPSSSRDKTLLGRIQADVRADRSPPGAPLPRAPDARARLDPADRSVQIHACHGRARQVEVLRDAILHLLADDDTLEPRDVIVMCPDIETFAPLIQATFGAGEVVADDELEPLPAELQPPDLRVRLADRSLRQTNPRARRRRAADRPRGPPRHRLGGARPRRPRAGAAALPARGRGSRRGSATGSRRAASAGVSTPLTARRSGCTTCARGRGRRAWTACSLGVTMTEEGHRLFEGVLPVDDVESVAIDLAGRLAELVDRARGRGRRLRRPPSRSASGPRRSRMRPTP